MSKGFDGYRVALPILQGFFSRESGKHILAGQVVRLNVCVGRQILSLSKGRETLREFDGERVAK